ncbi:hypothetical protein M3Y99_01000800 [Aphelenchoides fujianensis]|nr:hypothetical protein M3Y99_01000800 [Aphelenchoides fujianensis]
MLASRLTLRFAVAFLLVALECGLLASAVKCYSCASENMRENFLTRPRGPQKRIREPRLYDDMCDLDTWLIREKSAVECDTPFDQTNPLTSTPRPSHTECTSAIRNLDCLDQSTLIEHSCWCQGEFCNTSTSASSNLLLLFASTVALAFALR